MSAIVIISINSRPRSHGYRKGNPRDTVGKFSLSLSLSLIYFHHPLLSQPLSLSLCFTHDGHALLLFVIREKNLCVARGRVVKELESRSRGLGFDSHGAGYALNPHQHQAVMCTRWNENWYCVNRFSCRKAEIVNECVQVPGGNRCNVL